MTQKENPGAAGTAHGANDKAGEHYQHGPSPSKNQPLVRHDAKIARVLFLDVETRSRIDLKSVGAHRYAADPGTEILCAAYAVDDGPTQLWTPGEPVPAEFIEAARDDGWTVVAHHASFERCIMQHVLVPRHGWPEIPLEQWRCTMAMAYACALPGSLEKVAAALDLPHQKDADGVRLMRKLSVPGADGTFNEDPELLQRLYDYCRRDVEVERALFRPARRRRRQNGSWL